MRRDNANGAIFVVEIHIHDPALRRLSLNVSSLLGPHDSFSVASGAGSVLAKSSAIAVAMAGIEFRLAVSSLQRSGIWSASHSPRIPCFLSNVI